MHFPLGRVKIKSTYLEVESEFYPESKELKYNRFHLVELSRSVFPSMVSSKLNYSIDGLSPSILLREQISLLKMAWDYVVRYALQTFKGNWTNFPNDMLDCSLAILCVRFAVLPEGRSFRKELVFFHMAILVNLNEMSCKCAVEPMMGEVVAYLMTTKGLTYKDIFIKYLNMMKKGEIFLTFSGGDENELAALAAIFYAFDRTVLEHYFDESPFGLHFS